MVYRFSWVAGIAGIGLALARAERLLRPSIDGLPWEFILVTTAILGGTITWSGVVYRLNGWVIAALNVVGAVIAVVRIAVPSTTWFIFPTLDSFRALGDELIFARDVIRTGVAPVIPLAGVIAIMSLVFWGLGSLLAWGLGRGRPYVAVLAPLVVYLEFAVMDRRPGGWWAVVFMVFIGIALLAVALDRRREGSGSLTSTVTRLALVRSLPSIAVAVLGATLFVAVVSASAVAGLVPRSGLLDWRANTGLSGEYFGSISYNPFVGIRQNLVSPTNVPVFVADVRGDIEPTDVYWRLVALDGFDGTQWFIGGDPAIERPEDIDTFESPDQTFSGPTRDITQQITVLALQMDWLPAAYAPQAMAAQNTAVDRGYRVKTDDGSLRFDALTYRGMSYTVRSQIPEPDLDVLSRLADGNPSVVFTGAIDANEYDEAAEVPELEARDLDDAERLLELPPDLPIGIRNLAFQTTRNLDTDFEKAIALESFFRTPGNFIYSTSIVPGHGADDLNDWLLDAESDNYRTGYCEQFATSMAVMARILGIPSRVILGFTPGSLLEDGRVLVRDRNAHAWVELWMPTQGWVRFDPTPRGDGVNPPTLESLPFDVAAYLDVPDAPAPELEFDTTGDALFRGDEDFEIPERVAGGSGGEDEVSGPSLPSWLGPAALAVLVLFGFVPAVKAARRRLRLRRLENGDITAAWTEIIDRLTDLGDGPEPSATPFEFAASTEAALVPLADVYAASVYGAQKADDAALTRAALALEETEDRLSGRYSLRQRLGAQYRLGSLVPSWVRHRLRRR
jgi:hypothetical protein